VETELGFPLFDRNRRFITVTERGTIFLAAAEDIVRRYDACLQDIRAADQAPFSSVVIGVTPYINSIAVGKLKGLRQAYPQLKIKLQEGSSEDIIRRFRDGELQFLSVNTPLNEMDLHRFIIDEFFMYILLREGSPAARFAVDNGGSYPELDPVHLADEPLACSAAGSHSRKMALAIYRQAGFEPEFIQQVTRPTTLCTLAQNGTASSIFALSSEVRDSLSDGHYIYSIPHSYPDRLGRRYLMCRRDSVRRLPAGFVTDLEDLFTRLIQEA